PAMNTRMYENPMVQENIRKLKDKGYKFIEPESGILACKEEGKGRLADWKVIVDYVEQLLEETKDYKGKKVLVSAGPTRESIDPVRFITNRSSGKMGYAIAKRARDRGADVILVSGPTSIEPPYGIDVIWVESAMDMYNEIVNQVTDVDIFISAAAASDFRPADYVDKKIKKEAKDEVVLRLIRNPDILKEVSMKKKKEQIFVGFSAETHDLLENAKKKMDEKNLDLIVANKIGKKGSGFEADTNKISIIDREGNITVYPLLTKDKVADIILSKALEVIS
ncbi:MAG TPA: bifunctional phosphopantothenoylcysteine decarboxylase/phosphopantothenate--cysteine ligase CoaBC, partial [Candidatus Atribacteria bacterium]|nr:bifunctional phosphopantothenoylcysteine decarboxylase/phosphopantothenate--cysteine ligase CoaBC [Candidatus Atribacteria bacterium]